MFGELLADEGNDADEGAEAGGEWTVRATTGMGLLCASMIQVSVSWSCIGRPEKLRCV